MKTKKLTNVILKLIIGIVILFAVFVLVFFIGKYSWKLRGFAACEGAGIERVNVTDSQVEIEGYDPSIFPSGFIGYYAEEQDGKLYVGFKFSRVFGFFETGHFDIQIPTKSEIKEVYIKTDTVESLIWSTEGQGTEP